MADIDMPSPQGDSTDSREKIVKKPRMTPAEVLEAVQLRATGLTYREIGQKLGRNEETISLHISQFEDTGELARQWLTAQALEMAQRWTEAATLSAGRGKHEAAKDALLHARVIEPVADAAPSTGIVINVGNGTQPVQDVSSIPTITLQQVETKGLSNGTDDSTK